MQFIDTARAILVSTWLRPALVFAVAALTPIVAPAADAPAGRPASPKIEIAHNTVTIDDSFVLPFPKSWKPSGDRYRNAVELLTKGAAGTETMPEARTLVTIEHRLDHGEAVQRLAEIASTHGGTATYLSIGGWPAVQLRYAAPLAEAAERPGQPEESGRARLAPNARMAQHTTTAIAVRDTVVRMDTTVAPKASQARTREAEDMARRAKVPPRSRSRDTLDELNQLRRSARREGGAAPAPRQVAPGDERGAREPAGFRRPLASPNLALVGGSSETSAGVSTAGMNMIVSSNGGTRISGNGGATWTAPSLTFPFPTLGDPSIAIARSGNFYLSRVGVPGGLSSPTGCAASVVSSGNNGAVFAFAGQAALCPATGASMCLPDQPQIAADRQNASPQGGDQVYAIWRNFTVFSVFGIGLPANCAAITSGSPTSSMSCSSDSGSNWSARTAVGAGDFARLAVGGNGFVYAVVRDGSDVMIHKYTSCSNGLVELAGFPRRVASGADVLKCPVPGLDRCGEGLTAPTAAVDDTDPAHLYVAFGKGGGANDDILVADSVDGGVTWRGPIVLNATVPARRFMPWICTAAGSAYVGWYDRRAASVAGAASNDLTDFFLGAATLRNGSLHRDGERNLTGASDPQCASGWGGGAPDDASDSEQCSVQPQLAGACQNGSGGGSNAQCDFSNPACPSGESCRTGPGGPKYGDYNGIACGPDRVLATWASATAPAGFAGTPPAGIRVFADVAKVNGQLTVVERTIPANDPGRFNASVDGNLVLSSVSNATSAPTALTVTASHQVSASAAAGTQASSYTTTIGGDCDANGTVHLSALHPAVCVVTNLNRAYQRCVEGCSVDEGTCMRATHSSGERQQCIREALSCKENCSRITVTVELQVVPGIDAGKFSLLVDGAVRRASAGNGDSTPEVAVAAGVHSVAQAASSGTSLGNYTTIIGGDCSPAGDVSLAPGDQKVCTITNTRMPGTGADGVLTVQNVLVPSSNTGRFDLRIDGVTKAANVGNGGSTGPVTLLEGTHRVDELGNGTSLSSYLRTIGGACDASGFVTLAAGDQKTCTITNRKDITGCTAACNIAEKACMDETHTSGERQECIREKNQCVSECGTT